MFLEKDTNNTNRTGWIEIICGSMFSGKTEELIRRLNRAKIARQRVEIYKPEIDNRYDEENVVSHDGGGGRNGGSRTSVRVDPVWGSRDIVGGARRAVAARPRL